MTELPFIHAAQMTVYDALPCTGLDRNGDALKVTIIEDDCDCKAGYQHERGCPIAYWPEGS